MRWGWPRLQQATTGLRPGLLASQLTVLSPHEFLQIHKVLIKQRGLQSLIPCWGRKGSVFLPQRSPCHQLPPVRPGTSQSGLGGTLEQEIIWQTPGPEGYVRRNCRSLLAVDQVVCRRSLRHPLQHCTFLLRTSLPLHLMFPLSRWQPLPSACNSHMVPLCVKAKFNIVAGKKI